MSIESTLRGLRAARIEFVVVGGVAASAHGSAYVTNDVDICYDTALVNLRRLVALLRGWNAYLRGVEEGLPFTLDERTLRTAPVLTLVTAEGWLDIMDRVAGVGDYAAVLAASEPMELFDLRLNVLSLDALIAAKRAAARSKDQAHLLELDALRELRRGNP